MYLYLVQHGDAKSKDEDPARGLSDRGREDVRKVAAFVSSVKVEQIFHSGKTRAAQTAGIFAEQLGVEVYEKDGLAPMDEPAVWAERLKETDKDTMLVGHLPYMGKLASLLLCGDSGAGVVEFKMGGVVCLKREEGAETLGEKGSVTLWALQWMVVPELVK